MNYNINIHSLFTYLISGVWLINGLFCKIINLVPRHQQIVATISGTDHPRLLTIIIGLAETLMSIWILSRKYHRLNAILQIIIILTMNAFEFFLTPNLLLWGRMNAVFALLLIAVIWYNQFVLNKSLTQEKHVLKDRN